MKAEKVRMSLVFIAVLYILSLIVVVFWDVVREQIIIPLYYLVWIGGLVLKSISQKVFLVFLIIACIVIGANTINGLRVKGKKNGVDRQTPATSRYRFWSKILSHAMTSEFFRWEFALEARKLILAILSFQEGIEPEEVELKIKRRLMPAPPVIKHLVENREILFEAPVKDWLEAMMGRVQRVFSIQESQEELAASRPVETIIQFIEERLEMTHDGNQSKL